MNLKATAELGVDAGMMSLVPAELCTCDWTEVTNAIAKVSVEGGVVAAGTTAIVFKNDVQRKLLWIIEYDGGVLRFKLTDKQYWADPKLDKIELIILNPGIYLLADPCYIVRDVENYYKICNALNPEIPGENVTYRSNAVITLNDRPVLVCFSGAGDGSYPALVDLSKGLYVHVDFDYYEEDEDV